MSLAELVETYGSRKRKNDTRTSERLPTCRCPADAFSHPISELLEMEFPPVCGKFLSTTMDLCWRRVKTEGQRCWQHRS
jgi:hypothetical protein